jgi:hypothetical protein
MSLQAYYDEFRRGYWAVSDPDECPCHGRGWALSDVDTWHTCPIHFEGQLHPEACEGFEDEEDFLSAEEDSKKLFKEFQAARRPYVLGFVRVVPPSSPGSPGLDAPGPR